MAGINHLYDIYNKKGKKFIEELFNSFVTVNEKMDGSSFNFERTRETGRFKYYKRNQNSPITIVDRTISKYYEKPINYIESLPPHILERIPRGWRFGLEYFSNTNPVEISYDHLPKNNLILSYIHKKDEFGKIEKNIQDKEELDNFADLLGVEKAPIIFQGKLNDIQKNEILEFIETPFREQIERFKTNSFVSFIVGVLNPKLDKTTLNNNIDKAIEGIVFRFGDLDTETDSILAKMVDPVFTEIAKNNKQSKIRKKPSDFLGIALVDVMNFILERGIDSFKVEGDVEDERYVSFMSDVFIEFLAEYKEKYKGIDFQEPDYLKRDEFRLNRELLKDERVEIMIEKDESFESLFKLMLNSFRKLRKKAGGIISGDVIEHFNGVVKDIDSYIEKDRRKEKVNESEIPSFSNFQRKINDSKVEYITEESDDDDDLDNDGIFYSFNQFRDTLKTIEDQDNSYQEMSKSKNRINLIIGRMQPFHKGHLKMAKEMKEKNGLNTYIAVVHPGHNTSGKSPFDIDTVNKYMESVKNSNEVIEDFSIFNRGFLGTIIKELDNKGYTVLMLGAGEDRIEDYNKQIQYLENSEISNIINDKFKTFETKRSGTSTEAREKLINNDFSGFKKLVTPEIASLFNMLSPMMKPVLNEDKNKGDRNYTIDQSIENAITIFEKVEVEGYSKKQIDIMERIIYDFNKFLNQRKSERENIKESEGFGTKPFLKIKEEGITHYFFKLERDNKDGEQTIGIHLHIGNYSGYEAIEGPKNSYFVMDINEISIEKMQDIAIQESKPPGLNDIKLKVTEAEIGRMYKNISKCILDYLEAEPKVTRIYDEFKKNLDFDGNYIEYMKSIAISYLGEEWKVQEGSHKNLVLLTR